VSVYYVGKGGNDTNPGTNWSNRRLTLNSAEDLVSAGDTVYVGPGRYLEQFTIDHSGSSGNPITYIGDITGVNTDGIGGEVLISSQSTDYTIRIVSKDYRTFEGFHFAGSRYYILRSQTSSNLVFNNICVGLNNYKRAIHLGLYFETGSNITLNGCFIFNNMGVNLGTCTGNNVVKNCVVIGSWEALRGSAGVLQILNSTILSGAAIALISTGGTIKNSILIGHGLPITSYAITGTNMTATYSILNGSISPGSTPLVVGTGCVQNYIPYFKLPLLGGTNYPVRFPFDLIGTLNNNSYAAQQTGTDYPSDDLYGISRPSVTAKNSWGAIQVHDVNRETTTTRGASAASIRLSDAGIYQLFVPAQLQNLSISVYVYREANYSGTAPQMIIRQPGESPVVITDTGSVSTWNLLTDKVRIKSDYCVVELVSNNTATSGSYNVFFDDLDSRLS